MPRLLKLTTQMRSDWEAISEIDYGRIRALPSKLGSSPQPLLTSEEMAELVNEEVETEAHSEALVRQLVSLSDFSHIVERSTQEVLDDIIFTINENMPENIASRIGEIQGFLLAILDTELMKVSCKARRIAREHDTILSTTAVITDFRPIFGSDRSEVVGGVLINYLKIDGIVGGEQKSFSFVLDQVDIARLREQLNAVETKGEVLSKLGSTGEDLRVFVIGEDGIATR